MRVRPQLPIQGIDIILGNNLAGVRVWKDGPPLASLHINSEYIQFMVYEEFKGK